MSNLERPDRKSPPLSSACHGGALHMEDPAEEIARLRKALRIIAAWRVCSLATYPADDSKAEIRRTRDIAQDALDGKEAKP